MTKQSILKKRKRNRNGDEPTTKHSVSFASTSSTKFFTKEGKSNDEDDKDKNYHEMSIDEEDALDPNYNSNECSNSIHIPGSEKHEKSKIRNAKAARAMKRHIEGDDFLTTTTGGEEEEDAFQGEETTSEKFSLSNENSDCPIEPFNLKSEREDGEGYFDGDTYVFRRGNGDEVEDAWLDNLDDHTNNKDYDSYLDDSSRGISMMSMKRKQQHSLANYDMTKEEVYEQLLPLLSSNEETILQALSRYGAIVKREKKKQKQIPQISASGNALNKITELCNICMMNFEDGGNIYDFTKAKLQHFLSQSDMQSSNERKRKSNIFDENLSFINKERPQKQSKMDGKTVVFWEYKGNEDNQMHGPFSTTQMMEWVKAGFFVGENAVDVRIASTDETINTEHVKEETVEDLLGDLEDSDNEDDAKDTTKQVENKWLRSDLVKFDAYL